MRVPASSANLGSAFDAVALALDAAAEVARREGLADYYAYMRENVEEAQALFADLLISVTSFFRDPSAFEALVSQVIPQLFDGREAADQIRVWVPGCATGEEAYTVGMLLLEEAARREFRPELQVFGSDLDTAALEARCREKLASFKVPRRFQILEKLPRNALGKVQKHLLPRGSGL